METAETQTSNQEGHMGHSMLNKIADKLNGKMVYVEGTTPIIHNGGAVYSPTVGKLVGVYDEGIAIIVQGNTEESYMFFANIRGIELHKKASDIVTPDSKIVLGS
jgi:hypothetical protein